jgi:hypothetical protein
MNRVWLDAEVPVEFHGPSLTIQNIGKIGFFGNLIHILSPLIIIVISLALVLMSFYGAPSSLTISESPVVYPPKYFLLVAHGVNSSNETIAMSVFDSNLPFMSSGAFQPMFAGSYLAAGITPSKYLNASVAIPRVYK